MGRSFGGTEPGVDPESNRKQFVDLTLETEKVFVSITTSLCSAAASCLYTTARVRAPGQHIPCQQRILVNAPFCCHRKVTLLVKRTSFSSISQSRLKSHASKASGTSNTGRIIYVDKRGGCGHWSTNRKGIPRTHEQTGWAVEP